MNELVLQAVNLETIFSNILGGGIALLVAIWVSRREADRQARQQRENWYRKVHNTCVRIKGGKEIDQRGLDDAKMVEYAQLYRAFSEQIEDALSDAPDEVDLPLFNALQNVQLSCIRYATEVDTPNPHKTFLQSRHETLMDFSLIALYIIEEEKSPGIEYLDTLSGGNLEEARKKYGKFVDGTLYDEQNERVRETLEAFSKLEEDLQ